MLVRAHRAEQEGVHEKAGRYVCHEDDVALGVGKAESGG